MGKAFMIQSEQVIRDWETGQALESFAGDCTIFFAGKGTEFETGIEDGERFWNVKRGESNGLLQRN